MTTEGFVLSRRGFLAAAAAVTLPACLTDFTGTSGNSRLLARPTEPLELAPPGISQLNLGETRDGFLYVPTGHDLTRPLPLMVLLHGSGDGSSFWTRPDFAIERLANERGLILLAPDSRNVSWDVVMQHQYGPDPQFIDRALQHAFARCNVDPTRVGMAGFSDGGTTALSLGLSNGDLFSQLGAFSPGFVAEGPRVGKPGIFVSHGTRDVVFPVATTGRAIVTRLRQSGYQVEYQEFEGQHGVPGDKLIRVLDRLVGERTVPG
ncbi:MAG: hypothetical protein KJZ47_00020 [Gemmatimonadales bacterium]|nr:hypothetical protein [Gemmatimonadales bacterium]